MANWNETQNNKAGLVTTLKRLDREVIKNIAITDKILQHFEESKDNMKQGREALNSCTYTPENQLALERLLFDLVEDLQPNFVNVVADQLAAQNSYQELLSSKIQEAFSDYIATIQEEDEQLTSHYNNIWAQHVNYHPSVNAFFSGDTSDVLNLKAGALSWTSRWKKFAKMPRSEIDSSTLLVFKQQ